MPEQVFQPTWDEQQTRQLLEKYKGRAHELRPEEEEALQQHASHYNVPFFTGDFSLLEAIKQAGSGFVEGFTTISPSDDPPDNEYEQVFRSIGHLAGFAPGIMATPLRALGMRGMASTAAQLKSAPLWTADKITKYAKTKIKAMGIGNVGRSEALKTANNFYLGQKAAHIAEGAFHLGTASALAEWRGSVDEQMSAFKHGALAGGVFKAIGNLIPGTKAHEKVSKAIAGSLFLGIPSTARGATTPEQVYEYLMGAYFGGNEVSWAKAQAYEVVNKVAKKMESDSKFAVISRGDPEYLGKEFTDLPEPVKVEAKEIANVRFATPDVQRGIAYATLKELDQLDKIIPDLAEKAKKVEYVDGEKVITVDSKDIPSLKQIMFSGGASGYDTIFAEHASRKGKSVINYTFEGPDKKIKAKGYKHSLKIEELEDANGAIEQANRTLQRDLTKTKGSNLNFIRRNWYQVKFSDSVYAVGEIARDKSDNFRYESTIIKDKKTGKPKKKTVSKFTGLQHRMVKGGTGWAVQMGIDKGIPVYVFDQVKKGWYQWNYKANRFTRIGEPPRPTDRFAGIGARNTTESGKQAVSRLFDRYWVDTTTTPEKVSEKAEIRPDLDAAEKRLANIDLRLTELNKELAEIHDTQVLARAQGTTSEKISEILAPIKSIKDEYSILTAEKNELQNLEYTFPEKSVTVVTPEDTISSNEDISAQRDSNFEGKTEIDVGDKAQQFTRRHLKKMWYGATPQMGEKVITPLKVGATVNDLLNFKDTVTGDYTYIKRGSKKIKSEELANDLEAKIKEVYKVDITLTPEARGELRQWLNTRNNGKFVTHLQSDGKTVNRMINDANPRSQTGARKHQLEPKKHIEFIFEDAGGKVEVDERGIDKNPVYMVLDHVSGETKDGGRQDWTLSQFRKSLLKQAKWKPEEAQRLYDNFISKAMSDMMNEGYYAFGGRADGDRINWVRFHPEVEKNWGDNKILKRMLTDVLVAGNAVDKNFMKDYISAREDFKRQYGRRFEDNYDKMYLSNILYDLSMNGLAINQKNMKLMMGDGFISDSKAFNKRSQVWFTNGYSGDSSFIRSQKVDGKKIKLNDDGSYNYTIVTDLPKSLLEGLTKQELKEYQKMVTTMNIHNSEHVDGAIIVRDDILQAISRDFGVVSSKGQNKSFIIQKHPEYGALLGKFMFHSAGKSMSELMRKTGNLHMIMQDSAVKQRGTRKVGDYFINTDKEFSALKKDEIEFIEVGKQKIGLNVDSEIYQLKPEEVFGNYGVYGNEHMTQRQRLPKQVLGNLVELSYSKIDQKIIDEMFDDIIQNSWQGNTVWNERVDLYLNKLASGEGKPESLRTMEREIENNLDNLGIEKLVTVMKSEEGVKLSEAIYNKILKVEKENAYEEFMEGNITESEYNQYNAELSETTNIIDKMVRLSNQWVSEQKALGNDMSGVPIYMHKFIRDFRMKAVQNFIVNSATKPKMNNSAVGFIRPYDKAMQFLENAEGIAERNPLLDINNKEGINYKDDLFFLDKAHKEIVIHTDIINYERKTLGQLWNSYQAGEFAGVNKIAIEEIFRAATVRVPMDSISGVQVLKFGGFTGREGHGILMHSRAMRAEGGADLDGDKSFVFFGGKGGWQKSWKDAYQNNKKEHYTEDLRRVSDNKDATIDEGKFKGYKTYQNLLSKPFGKETARKYNSKAYQFAPGERLRISQAAVDGRGNLGPAVIQKQVITAAFNSIAASGGEDNITIEKWENNKKVFYHAKIKVKTDEASLKAQRKMGRAQLGLASDPLDVLGLRSSADWFTYMWDAHFEIVDATKRIAGRKIPKKLSVKEKKALINLETLEGRHLKTGILKDYYDINSAYWGRNWAEGRKHSMDEIKTLGKSVYNINEKPEMMNNALAKTGELLQGLDWSDSIFGRLSQKKVNDLYQRHKEDVRQFDWLKRLLGRPTFKVEMGNYINNTMALSLWKHHNVLEKKRDKDGNILKDKNGIPITTGKIIGGFDAVVNDTKLFKQAVKGTLFEKDTELMKRALSNEKGVREDILRQIRTLSEDFIVNDMTDLSTLHNVSRILEEARDSKELMYTRKNKDGDNIATTWEDAVDIIHRKVDYLKKRSYLMKRDRANIETHYTKKSTSLGKDLDDLDMQLQKIAFGEADIKKMSTSERRRIREIGDDITAALDQATIDLKIAEFNKDLTENGKRLFDQLMLGSLSRTNLSKIDALAAGMTHMDKPVRDLIHHYRKLASKTQTSRLGFNSDQVSDTSVKEHLGTYLNNYKEMWRPPTDENVKNIMDSVDKKFENIETFEKTGMPDDPLVQFIQDGLMESGYKGLKEAKLTKEQQSLASEIATLLKSWSGNKLGQELNGLVRGLEISSGIPLIGKNLNAMNLQDFKVLRNYLREAKRGNFIQRWVRRVKGDLPVKLGLRHWLQIPETVGRELMVDDIQLMRETGFFTDRYGNRKEGRIVRATNYIDMMNNWASMMTEKATGTSDSMIREFQDSMKFHSGLEDADALWQVAMRTREIDYARYLERNPDHTRSAEQKSHIKYLYSKLSEAKKDFDYDNVLKNKEYHVTIGKERGKVTGEKVIKKINQELDKTLDKMHKFISLEPGALEPYTIGYWDPVERTVPKIDYKKFIRHMTEHLTGGRTPWKDIPRTEVPTIFGIDGLRAVARSMSLDLMPTKTPKQRAIRIKAAKQPVFPTGYIKEGYFPRMFFDKKVANQLLREASDKILKTPNSEMSKDEKLIELKKIQYRHRSLEGDWNFKDMEEFEMFDELVDRISKGKEVSERRIKWFNANEKAGSMHQRVSNTGGYSIAPAAVEAYIRSLGNTYFRQLTQMFGREIIDRMGKEMPRKWGKEQTSAWQTWMKYYINDSIGNPTVISESVYQDPVMKLKLSPYGWWADNRVRDKINKIAGRLGLTNKNIPENLRGIDMDTVRYWSNLEAQYEMAALLAHPKSTIMNIFGGTIHTIQNAGMGNFVKAKSMTYLGKINPEWKSREDVKRFAISHGVVPEYLLYELGLQKSYQDNKGKSIIKEMQESLARNPDMSTESLTDIAKKHGKTYWETAVNFATKFMTVPEQALRVDSFMAHYIHAWEKFGGAIKDYDHPFLIRLAKKGVKATQFLYNAPNRPAFARTALGKVMARFQLYAWNSVKFRNEVRRQARVMGYMPGSADYNRLKRTFMIDMFALALANSFHYSMFESNLPQPWGWFQDTSEWIFGDEEERDRAFYGAWPTEIAPLQAVTPPALRLVGPTFDALLSDDWSRMSRYHIWNMFPFGRMARDLAGEGNLLENPTRIPEKVFGFPMQQLQRRITKAQKIKEEEEEKQRRLEEQLWR